MALAPTLTTSQPCEAHRTHAPAPLYCEEHHVIPQAWQHFATGSEALFDPRTMTLCRTGHGNVHFHLVRLMRAGTTEDPEEARVRYGYKADAAFEVAMLAMERWKRAGHSLNDLRAVGLYGAI